MHPTVDDPVDYRQIRPRDPLEMWLVQRWREVLGFPVGIRDNFFGMGGNSLDAARVVNAVWEEFEIQLPLNVLTVNPEVEKLAAELRGLRARLPGPLAAIQYGEGTHPPLFLVHPVSGQVGPYCGLSYALGDEFAVFGLQAAGLYSDEEPLETVPAMASRYVEALRSVDPAGPYCLGGCSTGSMIAFEMARQLVDSGSQVPLLAVIDPALVPGASTGRPRHDVPDAADVLFDMLVSPTGPESAFRALSVTQQAARVLDDWKAHEVVAENETTDFVRRARRVWQANDIAARSYSPDPYPGTIDVFRVAGSQSSDLDWCAVAPCRVHVCATDDEALGRQLRSRITAEAHA
ncbi:MAG TPA: thioesterase domain-containing protein [Pseudonocardiaceae bacterium]